MQPKGKIVVHPQTAIFWLGKKENLSIVLAIVLFYFEASVKKNTFEKGSFISELYDINHNLKYNCFRLKN